MSFLKNTALALVLGAFSSVAYAGPVTPFSVTDNGLTASFLAGPQPDSFIVSNVVQFVTLQGNTVIELNSSGNSLGIIFSQPLNTLALDFALSASLPSDLDYQIFSGGFLGTMVGSGSATGSIPPGAQFDEGLLTAGAPTFDAVVLFSHDNFAFAIDNLWVVTADPPSTHLFTFDAPEPFTLALFGAGLMGAGALRRRKASAAL